MAGPQMLLASLLLDGNPLPAIIAAHIGMADSAVSRAGDDSDWLFGVVLCLGATRYR